jgi:hypothetical protein
MPVLVGQLCRFILPVLWDPSFPQSSLFIVGIALLRSRYQCGIQDLA